MASVVARDEYVQEQMVAILDDCDIVDRDAFWAMIARKWAVNLRGGDVKKAVKFGLGPNPAQIDLVKVQHPGLARIRAECVWVDCQGAPDRRVEDVVFRAVSKFDGKGEQV